MVTETERPEPQVEQWAIVELMGHVRLAGKLTEVERFGCKMGRIDIPRGEGFYTKFFGGQSVYAITLVSEEAARAVASRAEDVVHSWELPKQIAPAIEAPARKPFDYSDSEDDPDKIGY